MDSLQAIARLASYRIHQSLVEKPLPIEKFWPLRTDKKRMDSNERPVMTKELKEMILKNHKIKL